jgi:hypothetical protein
VPAESERLRRRVSGRDRLFLGLVAGALIAATVTGFLVSRHAPDSGPPKRCLQFSHPNFTGGATYKYCGAAAVAFCRHSASQFEGVVAQCERLGFLRKPRRD